MTLDWKKEKGRYQQGELRPDVGIKKRREINKANKATWRRSVMTLDVSAEKGSFLAPFSRGTSGFAWRQCAVCVGGW